jgi:hypothetical protein
MNSSTERSVWAMRFEMTFKAWSWPVVVSFTSHT